MVRINVKAIDRKIEMFDGRPDRNTVINEDDILNLKIALNEKVPAGINSLHYFLYKT